MIKLALREFKDLFGLVLIPMVNTTTVTCISTKREERLETRNQVTLTVRHFLGPIDAVLVSKHSDRPVSPPSVFEPF